jgi:hypothetical protein
MKPPSKAKGGRPKTALQTLRLKGAYLATAFLANLFAEPFWFWEQKRGQLLDRIDNYRRKR